MELELLMAMIVFTAIIIIILFAAYMFGYRRQNRVVKLKAKQKEAKKSITEEGTQLGAMGARMGTSTELVATVHEEKSASVNKSAETEVLEKPDNIQLPAGHELFSVNRTTEYGTGEFLCIVTRITKDGENGDPTAEFHVFVYDFDDREAGLQFKNVIICESRKKTNQPA